MLLQRAKPCFDNEVAAILARLRRSRIVCSDETTVRIAGRTYWNWVFQNDQVVIHVVRNTRAANVVTETLAGHRPTIWVSDLYGPSLACSVAQQGHADRWQVCLAHQLRDCKYAIEAGDTIFAPRMKALLLRAVVLARRRKTLAESTRQTYQRRLDRELNAIMVLAPHQSPRQTAAKTLRQSAQPLVHLPGASRCSTRQQCQRAGIAPHCDLPEGDRRLPFQLGCGSIRRHSIRRWHRSTTGDRCVSRDPRCVGRGICYSAGLSKNRQT